MKLRYSTIEEEQVENYRTFVEDIARICFDMWKAYEVNGMPVLFEEKDENQIFPSYNTQYT